MARFIRDSGKKYEAWSIDQLAKSEFFHQKLHEWGLLEVAKEIESIQGETLEWDLELLGITQQAWDKVIHRGIMPIIVFAHPEVFKRVQGSVGYYRTLSMVSQKSMGNIGLSVKRFEIGKATPDDERALAIANHLNQIISRLIQFDDQLDVREFDVWRGMAAGTQAQGSWNNVKGDKVEEIVKGVFRRRIRETGISESIEADKISLSDGRIVAFAEEPDIGIYENDTIQIAIEIKGGIDASGVLERVGAAIKSLSRAVAENPNATTILLLQNVSMSDKATDDLDAHRDAVHHWFTVEDFIDDENIRDEVFKIASI